LFINRSPIGWSSKKIQGLQSLSSTEAEYVQLTNVMRELLWLKPQLISFGFQNIKIEMMEDNKPVISLVNSENPGAKTKHLDVRLKFIVQAFKETQIELKYVKSEDNIADMLTKPLPLPRLRHLRDKFLA
jgi:hypothetical protein